MKSVVYDERIINVKNELLNLTNQRIKLIFLIEGY